MLLCIIASSGVLTFWTLVEFFTRRFSEVFFLLKASCFCHRFLFTGQTSLILSCFLLEFFLSHYQFPLFVDQLYSFSLIRVLSLDNLILLLIIGNIPVQPDLKITEHVHIIHKCIIWCFIWIEIGMYSSIGKEFCCHIIKMVACLKIFPVFLDLFIFAFIYFICQMHKVYRVQPPAVHFRARQLYRVLHQPMISAKGC